MGDADAGQVERGAQVQGQPTAPGVVTSRGIEQDHIRQRSQRANCSLAYPAEAQGEQTGQVCRAGDVLLLVLGNHSASPDRDRRDPRLVSRGTSSGQAAPESHPTGGHQRIHRRHPRFGGRRGQLHLHGHEPLGIDRPHPSIFRHRAAYR